MTSPEKGVPDALAEIIEDFQSVEGQDKLQLLLELSGELRPLPEHLETASMEPVPECQTPLFMRVDASDPEHVHLHFAAPPESPTTRGFASILQQGLDGLSAAEILAVPEDFAFGLGLEHIVSPLRMRGLSAMLARTKRAVREQTESGAQPAREAGQ